MRHLGASIHYYTHHVHTLGRINKIVSNTYNLVSVIHHQMARILSTLCCHNRQVRP
jgi:hypothetical protein